LFSRFFATSTSTKAARRATGEVDDTGMALKMGSIVSPFADAAALRFLRSLHAKNPRARSTSSGDELHEANLEIIEQFLSGFCQRATTFYLYQKKRFSFFGNSFTSRRGERVRSVVSVMSRLPVSFVVLSFSVR
jgi:hypothetical protein